MNTQRKATLDALAQHHGGSHLLPSISIIFLRIGVFSKMTHKTDAATTRWYTLKAGIEHKQKEIANMEREMREIRNGMKK